MRALLTILVSFDILLALGYLELDRVLQLAEAVLDHNLAKAVMQDLLYESLSTCRLLRSHQVLIGG